MATKSLSPSHSSLILLLSLLIFSSIPPSLSYRPRKVGGRTAIKDVETNKVVQGLGRFAVEEYNKGHHAILEFVRVFKAEKQVVSGIKYFISVSTFDEGQKDLSKASKAFDAVVVVTPWSNSKQLLSFSPALN